MDAQTTLAIILALIGASGSLYAIYTGRQKASAETYDKLSATVDRQDERMGKFREEIDGLRDRVTELEIENSHLRERLRVVEGYLRRAVRQLQKAQITPDLPQDAIDELFKGT